MSNSVSSHGVRLNNSCSLRLDTDEYFGAPDDDCVFTQPPPLADIAEGFSAIAPAIASSFGATQCHFDIEPSLGRNSVRRNAILPAPPVRGLHDFGGGRSRQRPPRGGSAQPTR